MEKKIRLQHYDFVYSTNAISGITYSFRAVDYEEARKLINQKFQPETNDKIFDCRIKDKGYEVSVTYRIGGTYRMFGVEHWKTETKVVYAHNAEELFAIYAPASITDGLKDAVQAMFEGKRNKVEYNFGKGNALFIIR